MKAMAPAEAKWAKEERALTRFATGFADFRRSTGCSSDLGAYASIRAKGNSSKSARSAMELIEKFTFQFNALTQSRGGGGVSNMYEAGAIRLGCPKIPKMSRMLWRK